MISKTTGRSGFATTRVNGYSNEKLNKVDKNLYLSGERRARFVFAWLPYSRRLERCGSAPGCFWSCLSWFCFWLLLSIDWVASVGFSWSPRSLVFARRLNNGLWLLSSRGCKGAGSSLAFIIQFYSSMLLLLVVELRQDISTGPAVKWLSLLCRAWVG